MKPKIVIGNDLSGVMYKQKIQSLLETKGYEITNLGSDEDTPVDYPVFAEKVCRLIQKNEADLGILICGTGIGMSIAANKYKGIRAALCCDDKSATLAKEHNNANVICIGAKVISLDKAYNILEAFLKANFIGKHHQQRVDMVDAIIG